MKAYHIGIAIAGVVGISWLAKIYADKARRKRLADTPAPDQWNDILAKNLPMLAKLSQEQRSRLFSALGD